MGYGELGRGGGEILGDSLRGDPSSGGIDILHSLVVREGHFDRRDAVDDAGEAAQDFEITEVCACCFDC